MTTFGESHCKSVGVIIDGVPPRLALTEADIQPQLDRRRPGQSAIATKRNEADAVTILSGTENGLTLGVQPSEGLVGTPPPHPLETLRHSKTPSPYPR